MTEPDPSYATGLLYQVTQLVEGQLANTLCSILVLGRSGAKLQVGAAPSFPATLLTAIDGMAIGSSAGACGTAAYRKARVISSDIERDPLWSDLRDTFVAQGLRSAHSTPVLSDKGAVLGTIAVYYREPHRPDAQECHFMDSVAALVRIAIERAQLEEELREQSRRDSLTGALNHAAITGALTRILESDDERSCAVAMVDVDGMKATNDTYGHLVGDAVLTVVAESLMREGATVGRYGGDEFVVLLPGAERPEAEAHQGAVLEWLAAHPVYHAESGVRVPVSTTMGIAIYPAEAERLEDLIRLADSAMYASRRLEPSEPTGKTRLLDKERAAKLVSEIVPLLTRAGTREDTLRLVAHHLCVGAGYDAVNFEITGIETMAPPPWQRAFARAPDDLVEAWMREQDQTQDHPLSKLLEQTRRPVFLDKAQEDPRLREAEREIIAAAGLRSGLVVPMIWHDRLVGMVSVGSKQEAAFTSWDAHFLTAVASQVTAIVFMTKLVEELRLASENQRRAHAETVMMLAASAEAHDDTTGRHLQRVRTIAEAMARELGYDDARATELGLACVLHDIGKIRVPEPVLTSSSKLTDDEWRIMRQHTVWGAEFLSGRPGFELAETIARSHHERWDGTGYPLGIAGDNIPEAATITAVADSFDAMTNDRPYRAGIPVADAVREIIACSGKQFSPRAADALVRLFEAGTLSSTASHDHEQQAA
ncbi:MAG: HD domain-containing phosphohydrolase [Dehalococcoidia bacterium]